MLETKSRKFGWRLRLEFYYIFCLFSCSAYAKTIPRSFSVRFDAAAEKIEIVEKTAEENIKDNTWASKNLLNEAIYN